MRKLPILVVAALFVGGLAGCSSPAPKSSGTKAVAESPRSTSQSAAEAEPSNAKVEAVGFGRPAGSDYLWSSSIVSGVEPGQFAVVSFNLLGPDGKIVATEAQTEESINPNAKMIVGTQVKVPNGKEVTRVEASIGATDYKNTSKPKLQDVILEVSDYAIGEDKYGQPTAEAIITNPSNQQVKQARIGIACFNDKGDIIGGGSNYPDLIPPGGKVKVDASVQVSQKPARCEMNARPSD